MQRRLVYGGMATAMVVVLAATMSVEMGTHSPTVLGGKGDFSQVAANITSNTLWFGGLSKSKDSPIALVSQSGAVGTFTYSTMTALGLGVRYFANPGNGVDISVVELLTALAEEPDAAVLLGHIEGFQQPAALERLAAVAERAR